MEHCSLPRSFISVSPESTFGRFPPAEASDLSSRDLTSCLVVAFTALSWACSACASAGSCMAETVNFLSERMLQTLKEAPH
jgi:hypothetical protein